MTHLRAVGQTIFQTINHKITILMDTIEYQNIWKNNSSFKTETSRLCSEIWKLLPNSPKS